MLNLAKKKLLVVGLGKSGQSVAKRAIQSGANVWLYDDQEPDTRYQIPDTKERFIGSTLDPRLSTLKFDLVVTSPGIAFDHQIFRLIAGKGIPVISELEFAYQLMAPQFIIGITGTNGKTTVTELLGNIFKHSSRPYTIAGNIGLPLSAVTKVEGVLILELSSFQLHFIDKFRANIGAILNISQDHMDWHCCFGQYFEDKLKIFQNQQEEDVAILSKEEPRFADIKTKGKTLFFSVEDETDYYIEDDCLVASGEKILPMTDIKIKGRHNAANVLAAIACAKEAGIGVEAIREGITSFDGLKHRLQFVLTKNGVSFYNDSKSTNPNSTEKAIEAFTEPVILIAGGRNKDNDFGGFRKYLNSRVKNLILYGEAAEQIKNQVGDGKVCKTVEEALDIAVENSEQKDTIVFSPGCASFDLFENYAQRGDAFIKAVEGLDSEVAR